MTRLFARYVLVRRDCVVVRQSRYSLYRSYKAAGTKVGERRRALSHRADSYFARRARGDRGRTRVYGVWRGARSNKQVVCESRGESAPRVNRDIYSPAWPSRRAPRRAALP